MLSNKMFSNKISLNFVEFNPKAKLLEFRLNFHKSEWSPALFTLTFQYFYTDISAISVTFRNSD